MLKTYKGPILMLVTGVAVAGLIVLVDRQLYDGTEPAGLADLADVADGRPAADTTVEPTSTPAGTPTLSATPTPTSPPTPSASPTPTPTTPDKPSASVLDGTWSGSPEAGLELEVTAEQNQVTVVLRSGDMEYPSEAELTTTARDGSFRATGSAGNVRGQLEGEVLRGEVEIGYRTVPFVLDPSS